MSNNDPNITCPICTFRHPASRSCIEAKRLADEATAQRQVTTGGGRLIGVKVEQSNLDWDYRLRVRFDERPEEWFVLLREGMSKHEVAEALRSLANIVEAVK